MIEEDKKLQEKVEEVAVAAAIKDGLDKENYSVESYNSDFKAFAVDKIAVYQCYECSKPYAAGLKE
jgi:D-mannonate dehydratase